MIFHHFKPVKRFIRIHVYGFSFPMRKEICLSMHKKIFFLTIVCVSLSGFSLAQKPGKQQHVLDTSFTDYDALFSELDAFLDSLMTPRDFTLINVGVTSGYFNYETKENELLKPIKKTVYSPSVAYYSKSGLGISAAANILHDGQKVNPYQYSVAGSYDYTQNRKFITGVSLTRFFTKNDLPFYTSPLQNGAYAYFTYRNFWVKPTVAASYGWGSRSEYTQRQERISAIRLRPGGYTRINTQESINDFNFITSVRHDFYWLNVLWGNDFVRVSPQISFTSGTQKFGINQNSSSYATIKGTSVQVLYNSENVYLDDTMRFQPLSLTGFLKTEYSKGKFFIQPQVLFDYYFPAKEGNFSTGFLLNAGVIF